MNIEPHHISACETAAQSFDRHMKEIMASADPYDAMFHEGDRDALLEVAAYLIRQTQADADADQMKRDAALGSGVRLAFDRAKIGRWTETQLLDEISELGKAR